MSVIYTKYSTTGKVKVTCDCGWQSGKEPDEQTARLALAHHNYDKHPGRFPRWNPTVKAVEKTRRQTKPSE